MDFLTLIIARGGSKGIPGKNLKPLNGKPLITYSVEFARQFSSDIDICVSTDSMEIVEYIEALKLKVPFLRPAYLATDQAGAFGVVKHALLHYENAGKKYDGVILLQPTSPFRKKEHYIEAISLFSLDLDMVVSVIEAPYNPYFSLFEETADGKLIQSKSGSFLTRQETPGVYAYNGLIYIINTEALKNYNSFSDFRNIKKYLMKPEYNVDLDTPDDWEYAEYLLSKRSQKWEM